jgi:hypothetical protein
MSKTGINWSDMDVHEQERGQLVGCGCDEPCGINWSDVNVLSRTGINWSDIDVMSRTGINWSGC